MNNLNSLIEKLGSNQFNTANNTTKYTFDDVLDPQVKKELLLIQRVQLYKDFFAEEQLIASYRGMINNIVNSKTKLKALVGYEQVFQRAVSAVKACIRNYKLQNYKANKPSTYFHTNVELELKKMYKERTSQNTVSMSADLNSYKNIISNAESILVPQLGRQPSNEETINFIKNNAGVGSKIDLKTLERIKHYDTMEYSGSMQIGQDNAAGAENLTFEDVLHGGKDVEQILESDAKEQETIEHIREFTQNKNERRFLMAYLGIGEFKNMVTKGKSTLSAKSNGISYYAGDKLLQRFREFCAQKGMF